MNRRTFLAAVAVFSVIIFIALYVVLPVSAQTNSDPVFDDGASTTRSVDENTPSFDNIGAPVTATDADNDRLVYSLEDARTSPFTIVRATGQLQVGQPLDYEDEATYTVKVIVTDPDSAKDTITVTITVNNVEEAGSVSMSWTRPQVDAAITATLTDPDDSISGLTWQWSQASSRNGNYANLSGNGATSATYTPQSGDVDKFLRVTASYTDGESSGTTRTAQAVSATLVRAVPDPNSDPVFNVNTGGGYACDRQGFSETADVCLWIPRNKPAGDDIYYPAHVTDSDHSERRYSLSDTNTGSGHAALFRIDPSRGTLFTTAAHIYDNPTGVKFQITITVTDPSGGTDSINVVLKPSGGEGPPVVNGPSRITYPENGTWALATYTATAANQGGGSRPIHGWIIAVQPGGGDGDFFDIDDDGNLTFTQPPDYEDPADDDGDNTYSFSLHVYDTNPPNRGRPAQTFFSVSVTVTNEAVEALEIRGPSAVDYAENRTDAVANYTLERATAPVDEWTLSGADGGEFSISANGVLTFNRSPDYENPTDAAEENAYLVTITAYAGEQSKTEFVRVRVTDVNEPPKFDDGLETTLSVASDIGASKQIGDPYTATDPDKDAVLTYSLSTDTLPFDIDPYNGQLSTSDTLTQFDKSSYTVTVLVADGKNDNGDYDIDHVDDRLTVTINVEGGGNNAPAFPATETGARSFPENSAGGQNVGSPVAATDADDDNLTDTLTGTDAGSFQILGTGQIQTKSGQTYDHETKSSYSVTVTADDGNGGTATKDVTITVTNVEEPGTVTLSTNQPSARAAITATLTDPDNGVTGTVWQWKRSSDGSTGWADIGTDSPSYTTVDDDVGYSLRATASYTDGHGPNKTAQATTTQAVRAGSNRPPEFSGASATRSFDENTGAGQPIGDPVTATDLDNHSLTYSLEGTDKDSFQIVSTTGQIQTKSGVTYDHETTPTYTVTVKADDGNNGADTIDVTITVTNVDEPPEFDEEPAATRTVAENTPTDQDIGLPLAATDPEGDDLTYALDSTSAVSFDIDTSSGQLKTKAALDHETTDSYTVTVTASDGTNTVPLAVTVTVTDVNEPPTFATETATRTVDENTAPNTNIGGPVTATDLDNHSLTYSLDATGAASFDIDSGTGQIKTKTGVTYDHETTPSYTVTVTADDDNNGADTIVVTITVANVDEDGTVSLSSVQPQVDSLLTATLDDPDGSVTSVTWVWSRSTRPDSGWTNITGATSASYTPGDVDVDKYLRATASYTDPQSSGKSAQAVSENAVRAVPVDNGPPVFPDQDPDTTGDQKAQTREVAENTAPDTVIGDPVTATDPNSDTLTYSLGGTDAKSFSIVAATSQLQTKAPLDYETDPTYTVTVTATDPSGLSDEITVTINVTDLDEAPEIGFAASIDYAENRTDRIATYTANDPENKVITWRLSGVDGEDFEISGTGELRFKATPDYEAPADDDTDNRYEVTVEAFDGVKTGSLPLTITVTNVDEALKLTGEASIEYSENDTEPVATYTANDPEKGEITWSLLGDDRGDFSISSGVLTFSTPPDYEAPVDVDTNNVYEVTVKASDGTHTVTMDVTITVTDANDPPVVPDQDPGTTGDQNTQATREVAENTATGVDIGAPVAATDADSDTLTYSLGGMDAASFGIDTSTGQLQTKAALDYETKASYEVTVTVTASDETSNDTVTVTINVTNVDEDGTVTLSSLQPQVGAPLTATLTDPDGGVTGETWQWARSSDGITGWADIGTDSPSYTPVTDDVSKYLQATASYPDKHGSGKTAQVTTTQAVQSGANRPPVFPGQGPETTGVQNTETTREVEENTAAGVNIGDPVAADDQDTDDALTYTLGGTDAAAFAIVGTSGQLQTKEPLDYESKSSYTVTVTATDPFDASDTITVTINVTDVDEAGTVALSSEYPQVDAALTATLSDPDSPVTVDSWQWAHSDPQNSDYPDIIGETAATYTPVAAYKDKYLRATATYTDKHGSGKTAQAVSDNAVRVNTDPDFGADTTAARSVAENTAAGRDIGAPVTATDSAGDTLNYSLGGTDAASFAIAAATGQLQTKAALDYEAEPNYTVTVKATDTSGASDTITVTINVTDVKEPPGKPAAPTVTAASTSGHNTLSVTWRKPSNTGRPPISGYSVRHRQASGNDSYTTKSVSKGTTTTTITGLSASTPYEVQVRASNAEGAGPWSEPGEGSTGSSPRREPRARSSGGGGGGGGGGIVPDTPAIGFVPQTITFTAPRDGKSPRYKYMLVFNQKVGDMDFNVAEDASWLSLSPTSGRSPHPMRREPIMVNVDISGLKEGEYTATIRITAGMANNSPQEATIRLTVTEPIPAPTPTPRPTTTPVPAPVDTFRLQSSPMATPVPTATPTPVPTATPTPVPTATPTPVPTATPLRVIGQVRQSKAAAGRPETPTPTPTTRPTSTPTPEEGGIPQVLVVSHVCNRRDRGGGVWSWRPGC